MGFPKIKGYHFGGPYSKDYCILGSILVSHYFGKQPYNIQTYPCKGGLGSCFPRQLYPAPVLGYIVWYLKKSQVLSLAS